MAKTKPLKKKSKKSRQKSILNTVAPSPSKKSKSAPSPTTLLAEATALLQTGEPSFALPIAQQALDLLNQSSSSPTAALPALNLLAEIAIELGDIPAAHSHFLTAANLDPTGALPDTLGGGPEKFLWLAQLSNSGGEESVAWYGKGIACLTTQINELESQKFPTESTKGVLEGKRRALATALCATIEVYMTDLALSPDAEGKCESLITAALLHAPSTPEPLQTLASIRISQLRMGDAKAALVRSLEMWKDLPPEAPQVPDFPTRVSLARLLLEVGMEGEAIEVLERLVGEDDQSVEIWYLGGWGLWLMGEKNKEAAKEGRLGEEEGGEDWKVLWIASREWLQNCLKLYELLEWEDERLKEHAVELAEGLNKELGAVGADDGSEEDNVSLEDEWEDEDADGDLEMEGM